MNAPALPYAFAKAHGILVASQGAEHAQLILREGADLAALAEVRRSLGLPLQIENVSTPRPMTHDLLRNIITDLDGSVDRVVVSDLKDNTFFAIIHLTVRGERIAVDARPSDAIALALRTRSPILVEESVIDNAKTVDFTAEPGDNARLQKWLESLDPEELGKYKM